MMNDAQNLASRLLEEIEFIDNDKATEIASEVRNLHLHLIKRCVCLSSASPMSFAERTLRDWNIERPRIILEGVVNGYLSRIRRHERHAAGGSTKTVAVLLLR